MYYNSLNTFLKTTFGEKVYKITLDISATCPNRDGSLGSGGCIYCNPESSRPAVGDKKKEIKDQILDGIKYLKKRHHTEKFISYFQQNTNTYDDVATLRKYFYEAIGHPDIVGLAISTRPDCIPSEILDLLSEINKKTYLWVELGLQSADDKRLTFLRRGHTVQQFIDAVRQLHEQDIAVCAHVILGLPGEENKDIQDIANLINELAVEGIKIHNLHVLKDTPLEKLYNDGKITLPSQDEYAKKVVYLLERLAPSVLIHRFNSHAPRNLTVAPSWSVNKLATFNAIEKELKRQGTWQGKSCQQGLHVTCDK